MMKNKPERRRNGDVKQALRGVSGLRFKVIRLPKSLGFIIKKLLGIREH